MLVADADSFLDPDFVAVNAAGSTTATPPRAALVAAAVWHRSSARSSTRGRPRAERVPAAAAEWFTLCKAPRAPERGRRRLVTQAVTVRTGQPFALLRIPALGRDWKFAVVEGATLAQLSTGPGHVTGTQLPGQVGNFAVAAHDITAGNPFLHLKSLRAGGKIYVTTRYATYTYVVTGEKVVRYTDVAVLAPVPGSPGAKADQRSHHADHLHAGDAAVHPVAGDRDRSPDRHPAPLRPARRGR